MRYRAIWANLAAATVLGGCLAAPIAANAQDWRDRDRDYRYNQDYRYYRDGTYDGYGYRRHRQQKQNEWKNIAIGAGALGLLGLLEHDNTLAFAGGAGALYSAWRYDQDRRSENGYDRARAEYFSRPYFYRDGARYDRRTVWRNGHKYYQFVREE